MIADLTMLGQVKSGHLTHKSQRWLHSLGRGIKESSP